MLGEIVFLPDENPADWIERQRVEAGGGEIANVVDLVLGG